MSDDAELLQIAKDAVHLAMPQVSKFAVGAALLTEDGEVFTGANIESPSLLQVFCAERVALLKALSEGAYDFSAIAIYCPDRPGVTPCGLCRQMLFEFAPDVDVILDDGDGKTRRVPLASLFPEAFEGP
ncbi:cytidine deaminase [bacterium]|nr:cytidine deaminase [bacterium]MCB9479925.1 cytidine deaminase [Deltaproteobacteria bacterium]